MSIRAYSVDETREHLCFVVGLGLIGGQIAKQLRRHAGSLDIEIKNDLFWQDPSYCLTEILSIIERNKCKKIDLVWSAGKSGFSATDDVMQKEYDYFATVIHGLDKFRDILIVNLLSSAGGLYENSRHVTDINEVSPCRPYGKWKLRQEQYLNDVGFMSRIFRISSVYGFGPARSRAGIITTMIRNAKANKTTTVYASPHTLRDYVYHDDIANHVIQNIIDEMPLGTNVIASGRATSIDTLKNMIKVISGKNLRISYVIDNLNSNDILFSRSILPVSLRTISLEEGIRNIYAKL